MGVRVLLGAWMLGLVLLGSSGAGVYVNAGGAALAGADLAHAPSDTGVTPVSAECLQGHFPNQSADQASDDDAQPDSEVCTVLMVLRGPKQIGSAVVNGPSPSAPPFSVSPAIPPPEPWALVDQFLAEAPPFRAGTIRDGSPLMTASPAGRSDAPSASVELPTKPFICALSASVRSSTSLGAPDRSSRLSSRFTSTGSGESDSEVCTVLMVLRGPAPCLLGIRVSPRPLAPIAQTGPPVPPPEQDTAETEQMIQSTRCGADALASAATPEATSSRVADTNPSFSTNHRNEDRARRDTLGRLEAALRPRGARGDAPALAVLSHDQDFITTSKLQIRGSTQWGTL